ncbi:MAG: ABC transporter substrate-binding protein [Acidimicrobiia bacterium]|nr:ABC transporter substrate-binding protein [Acidimicrobiia bacterium]
MIRRFRVGTIFLVLALIVAACSGDGGESTTSTTSATPTSTTAPGTSTAPTTPTTAAPSGTPITTDGVTVTDDTIYLGILADLSGPFSGNVVDLIDAQLAFWARQNEAGGVAGRQVELLIKDTGYSLEQHQALYDELAPQVVMFSHSTGSPHTALISPSLVADDRLAIPTSWYSGWADPALGANVLEVGSNYCIEAMNTLSFLAGLHQSQFGTLPSIAIATDLGDYGGDSAAGARYAADQLGLTIAYDGGEQLVFGGDASGVVAGIAASGADYTWLATDPLTMSTLVAGALTLGYQGAWSGAMPSFSPRLLDTALGPYLTQAWFLSVLFAPMGSEVPGMQAVYEVLADAFPNRYPSDGLIKGYLEFSQTLQILERAAEAGDLTPAGVVAAAKDTGGLFFDGISPDNVYAGSMQDAVARATGIYRPSLEIFNEQGGLEATFAEGAISPYTVLQPFYISDLAAAYDFQQPCYLLDG